RQGHPPRLARLRQVRRQTLRGGLRRRAPGQPHRPPCAHGRARRERRRPHRSSIPATQSPRRLLAALLPDRKRPPRPAGRAARLPALRRRRAHRDLELPVDPAINRGMDSPGLIHVLTGETAVGKTELALAWAEANDAEIVSCDSTLFYRGMDIGTAKPSPAELARVRHHLIDIRPVDTPVDITEFTTLARAAVADILARGRRVLVTGGSGFYLKTFFAPVADDVAVPPQLRADVTR